MVIRIMKKFLMISVFGGLSLLLVSSGWGDVIPTSVWADFYGSATTYNGESVPVGSVIDAYDPDAVHCGSDTVVVAGHYGFMPVYGNDSYGDGPEIGEAITFYINGRLAVPEGPDGIIWQGMGTRSEVNLSALAQVSMEEGSLPDDQYAAPGDTVRYIITVRNTGEGTDFYSVSAVSSYGWIIKPMAAFAYALPDEFATLYFDVLIPLAIYQDVDDEASFKVTSGVDTSVHIESSVITHVRIPTDAPEDDSELLPGGFRLHQNYPNPFNPSTTISFDLPSRADVELVIFDLLGKRVNSFNLGNLNTGHHKFAFDGEFLASGIYFYRLKAGEFSSVRKMVLMK